MDALDPDRALWKRRSFLGWTATFGAAVLTRPALALPVHLSSPKGARWVPIDPNDRRLWSKAAQDIARRMEETIELLRRCQEAGLVPLRPDHAR